MESRLFALDNQPRSLIYPAELPNRRLGCSSRRSDRLRLLKSCGVGIGHTCLVEMLLMLAVTARGDEDASVGGAMTGGRRVRPGLSGFVAFMRRKDAEVAVKDLDGFDWGGCVLRVGWGKSVRLPLRPIYGELWSFRTTLWM